MSNNQRERSGSNNGNNENVKTSGGNSSPQRGFGRGSGGSTPNRTNPSSQPSQTSYNSSAPGRGGGKTTYDLIYFWFPSKRHLSENDDQLYWSFFSCNFQILFGLLIIWMAVLTDQKTRTQIMAKTFLLLLNLRQSPFQVKFNSKIYEL